MRIELTSSGRFQVRNVLGLIVQADGNYYRPGDGQKAALATCIPAEEHKRHDIERDVFTTAAEAMMAGLAAEEQARVALAAHNARYEALRAEQERANATLPK